MSFTQWVDLGRRIVDFGFISTAISALFFILLTVYFVKEKVGSYRYLLLLLPITGFFFVSFEFLLDPFFHSYNTGITLLSMSTSHSVSIELMTALLGVYTCLYAMTISTLALQFIYRYWAVFRPRYIKTFFNGARFSFSIVYLLVFGVFYGGSIYTFTRMDEYATMYLKDDVFEKYGVFLSEQPCLTTVAFDENGSLRRSNFLAMFAITLTMVLQYGIIIYCAVVMAVKMQSRLSMLSAKIQRMHKQFYHALLLQVRQF
ncbi:unnamed protein product [Caenorhabditis sp. 36 PRJEB53466]|nr:unnamed protein product [Caenorhabditis sp. 36 PRJEB53466]